MPLSSFVNNLPTITYQTNIQSVEQDQNSGQVAVLLENGETYLYDTQANLVQTFAGNIRVNSFKRKPVHKLIDKKNKMVLNLDASINEKVFEVIAEQKKTQAAEPNPDNIEPDAGKLDQLYHMGFTVELARKALIKTKNQSLDLAIEAILALQGEDNQLGIDEQALLEAVSLMKPVWECNTCTVFNEIADMDVKDICSCCGAQAPVSAYYTKEEIDQMKEDESKVLQAEIDKQQSLLEQASNVEAVDPTLAHLQGVLADFKISSTETNFMSRFLIAAAFNDGDKSTLRLRRLGYSGDYLKSLIREDIEGTDSVTSLRIGNIPLVEAEGVSLEKTLSDNFRDHGRIQVDSLIPFYCYKGEVLETIDQIDLPVEGQILAIQFSNGS